MKELRGWSRLPVIVVSARSTERDKILALDCGADDYITKPFSSPELLARMRAVLRRNAAAASPEDVYCVGDFKIDFVKRIVTVGGEPVRLTQVEYRIVELIARQPGNVLTYRQIIHHVWGPYADVDNNRILRVNMSNIRRKIERDSMSPQYILTEIGVGYRMGKRRSAQKGRPPSGCSSRTANVSERKSISHEEACIFSMASLLSRLSENILCSLSSYRRRMNAG